MFERYTEKARRVIFFARYEASQRGAHHIEPPHLFLAILREDKVLFQKLLGSSAPFVNPAESLGLKPSEAEIHTSADLPLSSASKRVLTFAAYERAPLITPGHLLLGLMQEPGPVCDLLEKNGLEIAAVRLAVQEMAPLVTRSEIELKSDGNAQIIEQLREQFAKLTWELKPEMEPAVVYRLEK
jgi:ATP-dependent Clp protease ATP-binding subunit ClpC